MRTAATAATAAAGGAAAAEHKEVRKVQFTGRSTYVLSLPKRWIEEMHLHAGDQVTLVRETDNSLSIVPTNTGPAESLAEATAIITSSEGESSLRRKVVSMYLAGYNIIHLKLKAGRINPALRDAVRDVVRRNLVGTEMIADASDIITLQVLLSLPELSVNTAIRRMYLIASSMHRDAMTALSELNQELAREVIKSDDEVDRFSLYVLRNLVMATQNGRVLREMGLKSPSDCLSYRVAVKSIERVADHACGIAEMAAKLKDKIPKETLQKIEKMSYLALTVLGDSVEALLRRDYQLADKTVDQVEGVHPLEEEALAFVEKARDPASLKLVLEDIRRTAEYASDIAEAALNETIEEVIEKSSAHK
ncbi:phosphate signaling complex PhoU family protein [Nitrososphaera viennensis]|uniref:Phosphate-specific transport system accessory protein PhoU n=2 Tax=Nitrososphaera viennensis TaxID=1034015 RepID=A0A060HLI5_9ARCH|nr:phosphate uptake regulator PhoU [Nitrososphaera viennensis]AIC16353.1 Phosphate-specific transport system accessory protein PhoU [Nitrososphaera viennensis EN76]UVS68289.1 phosphate uptake regulator PhoU [Nitrososphaera viennensis]